MTEVQGKLIKILGDVAKKAKSNFSGIGLVYYKNIQHIPCTNLRESSPSLDETLINSLSAISLDSSDYHDGFHLIDQNWNLTHVSQYFSPPIIKKLNIKRQRKIGGRYMAAQYGSAIDGVLLTGIASPKFGIAIFHNGNEVYFGKIK